MIVAYSVEDFYNKNKVELLKLVAKDQSKPIAFDLLEYSFVDLDGRKYYSFPESTSLPIERLAKLEETKIFMSSGLHVGVIEELTGYMNQILGNIVNNGLDAEVKKNSSKNIGVLGMLINEIKERQDSYMPIELFYSYLAIQLVRDDENPHVFNQEIHINKINSLMALNAANGGFFFGQKELKPLQSWLNMSEQGWQEYWGNSVVYHRIKSQALLNFILGSK